MLERDEIVAAARRYIGTPYHHQAALAGAGCDCLGLIRGVWRDLYGTEPETPPPYTPDWGEVGAAEPMLDAARRHLVPVALDALGPGDVVLFRMRPGLPGEACRDPERRRPYDPRPVARPRARGDDERLVEAAHRCGIRMAGVAGIPRSGSSSLTGAGTVDAGARRPGVYGSAAFATRARIGPGSCNLGLYPAWLSERMRRTEQYMASIEQARDAVEAEHLHAAEMTAKAPGESLWVNGYEARRIFSR